MSILPTTIPGAWTPSTLAPYVPYYGQGSSNQVYSNSIPVENQASDGDGENQPSRPYIPDSGNSVSFAPFGAVPNANGGIASMNVITLEPASAGFPGGVSNVTQSFSGIKTFVDAINLVPTSSPFVGVVQQASVPILHTFGSDNLFLGSAAGNFAVAGSGNVGVGRLSLNTITSAIDCTGVGAGAARNITSGSLVTCIGKNAGFNLTTGSNNIFIGANSGLAVGATVSNVIDIGNGTIGASVSGDIRIGQSATLACYIAGIGGVAAGGTPQMVVIDPATRKMGSQAIAASGVSSLAPIGAIPNAQGATITGAVLNLEPASGTFGGVLTTIAQSIAGIKTFNDAVNIVATSSSAVGTYQQAGAPILHTYGNNLFLGGSSGNFTSTGSQNTGLGAFTFGALTTGVFNVAVGRGALNSLTTAFFTTAVGVSAGRDITTGGNNVFMGTNAGAPITTGGGNVIIGASAGFASAVGTSNVIEISDGTMGTSVTGDVRIGTSVSLKCYLGGIKNTTVLTNKQMTVIDTVTNLVERIDIGTTFNSQVCTLDAGAITTMTVRGAATTTMILALSKTGTQVSMRIPAFSLTAQTAAATSFIITGAGVLPAAFRPTYSTWFTTLIFNGVPLAASDCYVTSGGVVTMQLRTGFAFTLPAGPAYDINLQWQID